MTRLTTLCAAYGLLALAVPILRGVGVLDIPWLWAWAGLWGPWVAAGLLAWLWLMATAWERVFDWWEGVAE